MGTIARGKEGDFIPRLEDGAACEAQASAVELDVASNHSSAHQIQVTSNTEEEEEEEEGAGRDENIEQHFGAPRARWWGIRRWQRASQVKLVVGIAALGGIVTVFALLPTNDYLVAYAEWSKDKQVEGAFIFALIYIVLTVVLFPCSILTVLSGLLFGLPIGIPTVVLSATAGSVCSFLLGRYLLHDAVQRLVDKHKTMSALYRVLGRSGFKVGVLLRLSPIIPFNALNYAISLTPISLASYMLSTFLGIIPGTCLFVYIGSTAKSVAEATSGNLEGGAAQVALFWIGLVVTIFVTVFITWYSRRELVKELALDAATPEGPCEAFGGGDGDDGVEGMIIGDGRLDPLGNEGASGEANAATPRARKDSKEE